MEKLIDPVKAELLSVRNNNQVDQLKEVHHKYDVDFRASPKTLHDRELSTRYFQSHSETRGDTV